MTDHLDAQTLCRMAAIACQVKMLVSRYKELVRCVCVDYGFCGCIIDGKPSHVSDFIPKSGSVTAKQFAEWTMQADGFKPKSPETQERFRNYLIEAFQKHMGADVVCVTELMATKHSKKI